MTTHPFEFLADITKRSNSFGITSFSCKFNIDTACVEIKLTDGSMVSINCISVENEYANNMYEVSELGYVVQQNAVLPLSEN